MRKRRTLLLEELEPRLCLTAVCAANPTYQAECQYLDNLLPTSQATIIAVQSGNWSDPATWGGRTPTTGDNVWIPAGCAVTVDGQEAGSLRSILDNGTLTFATTVETSLTVNTLVVGTDVNGTPTGELDIGTASSPIQTGVTASLVFADSQSVAPGTSQAQLFPNDPDALSGGLISMGTLNIYGSEVTPYVNLASGGAAGSNSLVLAGIPVGWSVGDTLLLPGTDPSRIQTEQVQIAAIQDNSDGTATITLASPLQYTHAVPAGQSLQIADENRNVVIEDQGTATQYADGSDGHVMQMHNDAAAIYYASFLDPGRTDKSVPLGSTLANGTINHVGRYSLHFHRAYWPSINGNDPPIQVVGCYQSGSPGWGFDNHSSNVDFIDDVAFGNYGASFVDEAGNELGSFQGCLSVQTTGVPNTYDNLRDRANRGIQDFGFNGEGFWLTSPYTSVTDCHVWDAQLGYAIYSLGLIEPGLGQASAWGPNGPNGQDISNLPLAPFVGDTAGEVQEALNVQYHIGQGNHFNGVDNFTAWGITQEGITLQQWDQHFYLHNVTLLGESGASYGIRTMRNLYTVDIDVSNADVEGFQTGYKLPDATTLTVEGGYWDDVTAFDLTARDFARVVTFSGNVQFGPTVTTDYFIEPSTIAAQLSPSERAGVNNALFSLGQVFLPDGSQLYAPDQAADFVPFPTDFPYPVPSQFVGLTNAQLLAQYGICIDGEIAPSAPMATATTNGMIGQAQATPIQSIILSSQEQRAGTSYTLKWKLVFPDGTSQRYQDDTAVTLAAGWNVFTRTVNGENYTWMVWGS